MKTKDGFIINLLVLILVIVVMSSLIMSIYPLSFKASIFQAIQKTSSLISFKAKNRSNSSLPGKALVEEVKKVIPFTPGEKLTYVIKYKGLNVGKAVLTFHGESSLLDENVYLITLYTSTPYYKDLEKIYAQKDTFLPVKVEREIKRLGNTDLTIEEIYDQDKFRVKISRKGFFRSKDTVINKSTFIHNAILLSYYYRTKGTFSKDEKFTVNLPTKQYKLLLKGKESVSTPLGEYSAYAFEADSSQFSFWLKDDIKRTPLKIEDPRLFGYSLLIKSIENAEQLNEDNPI